MAVGIPCSHLANGTDSQTDRRTDGSQRCSFPHRRGRHNKEPATSCMDQSLLYIATVKYIYTTNDTRSPLAYKLGYNDNDNRPNHLIVFTIIGAPAVGPGGAVPQRLPSRLLGQKCVGPGCWITPLVRWHSIC